MCSIAARSSANGLENAIHDVGVDVTARRMLKGVGKAADDLKAKALPKADGAPVGADHEIVLHRSKSAFACAVERMRAHRSARSAARCGNGCHVAAIGDVCSAALLIRLQAVRADDFALVFCDEHPTFGGKPVRARALFVHAPPNEI